MTFDETGEETKAFYQVIQLEFNGFEIYISLNALNLERFKDLS